MLDITTDRKYKCFAYVGGGCTILTKCKCKDCRFYKPADCEDWVKVEEKGRVYIMPPEEYDERRKKHDRRARLHGKGVLY